MNDYTQNVAQLYTLHARKLYDKLSLPDSLRLGAILVGNWLYDRLGTNAPSQLRHNEDEYKKALPGSLHLSHGYIIDTISEADCGVWAVRFVHPQVISDPDNPSLTHYVTVEANCTVAFASQCMDYPSRLRHLISRVPFPFPFLLNIRYSG